MLSSAWHAGMALCPSGMANAVYRRLVKTTDPEEGSEELETNPNSWILAARTMLPEWVRLPHFVQKMVQSTPEKKDP